MYPAKEGVSFFTELVCYSYTSLLVIEFYSCVVCPCLRHSAGKADKFQGTVPASVASRKNKPSTPAYAAVAPGGRRPAQKEPAPEGTEKTSLTPTGDSQPLSRSSTKVP